MIITEHVTDFVQNLNDRCLYNSVESFGISQEVLDNVWKTGILESQLRYQSCPFPGQDLTCGFVKLQDLLIDRYECLQTIRKALKKSLLVTL